MYSWFGEVQADGSYPANQAICSKKFEISKVILDYLKLNDFRTFKTKISSGDQKEFMERYNYFKDIWDCKICLRPLVLLLYTRTDYAHVREIDVTVAIVRAIDIIHVNPLYVIYRILILRLLLIVFKIKLMKRICHFVLYNYTIDKKL